MRPLQTPAAPSGATSRLARSLAALLILTFAALLHAADAPKVTFDLPADSAEKALKRFSEQSGQEVLFASELAKGIKCNPVHGEMTAADALNAMLTDTGLVAVQEAKSGAFSVRRESSEEAKNVSRAIAQDSDRPNKSRTESDSFTNAQGEQVLKLPEYMVTGTKSLNTDIRRTQNDPQPYIVFNGDDIEASQAANLEEFFRTRLTMNSQQRTNEQQGLVQRNVGSVNLRGLGANQTLILVDGRRMPLVAAPLGDFGQADINGIPIEAIERIEVLPSTAGAIYGGGAVGGVINIVKKKKYNGTEIRIDGGGAFDGGAEYIRFSISGGVSLNHGRTQISYSASYRNPHPLCNRIPSRLHRASNSSDSDGISFAVAD